SRTIISESDEVAANALKLIEQLERSYREAAERRSQLVVPPAELTIPWDDVAARLLQATAISELGVDAGETPDPATERTAEASLRSQPTREFHGRIADWVADVRGERQEGTTTVFVAATSGRAERTIETLKEYEVLAVPVEHADDARYAAVLVAVGNLSRGFRL